MVKSSRELELSMGDGKKKIEKNEKQSVIVQRRGAWLIKDKKNEKLNIEDCVFLRPCPKNSISIFDINKYLGKKFRKNIKKNSLLTNSCLKY